MDMKSCSEEVRSLRSATSSLKLPPLHLHFIFNDSTFMHVDHVVES